MAERFWEDGRIMEVDSGPELGFHLQTYLNFRSEENIPNSRLNGNTDAAKADEEFPAEGGAMVTRRPRGRPLGSKNKPKMVTRRPRGRPLGSKNKPKNPLTGIREISDTMKSRVLKVPSGFDITDILETFMRTCQLGVVVIGGSGYVTNVTLRQPIAVGGIVHQTGVFEIVSLTGAFPRGARTQGGTGLKVSLTNAQGNYVGGTVGSMIAYGEALVIVSVVMDINSEELNVQPMQPPGLFLSPAAMASQQHFQTATMMTVQQQVGVQSPTLMTRQQQVGIQSPTPMTVQPQIGMTLMNRVMQNPAMGSVRPNSHEISLQTALMVLTSRFDISAMGSVRPNSHDISLCWTGHRFHSNPM
jgi:predicted DNA-binding protein with PD1-like motif